MAAEEITRAGSVVIFNHERPDGDAVSSLCASFELVRQLNNKIKIQLVSRDGVPEVFSYLKGSDLIQTDFMAADVGLMIILDCGDLRRTGYADRILQMSQKGIRLVNIDHHPKNDLHKLANVNVFDESAASTTQIIFNLANALNLKTTPSFATSIFTGLYTDTGSFQHPNTTNEVFSVASALLSGGARFGDLQKNVMCSRSVPMLKIWGRVMERIRTNNRGVVMSVVTLNDLKEVGANQEDIAGLVSMLESDKQCRLAVLLTELKDGKIKAGLRSNNSRIDVSRLAKLFGGGGHPRASGFEFDGRIVMDKTGWKVVL